MAKFYAVRKGKRPGIYHTWPEAQKQVAGFSGAEYKSFPTKQAAEAFMTGGTATSVAKIPAGFIEIYVDGSFNADKKKYGSGWVAVKDQQALEKHAFAGSDPRFVNSYQIAGEVFACLDAIIWAKENGYPGVVISYDYEGIAKWAQKDWQANSAIAKDYVEKYQHIAQGIQVVFNKVKAHTGVDFNEMADQLAKGSVK
ncbi:ribonuclease H1 domain-containing protein [Enterococcus sp. CSURQ0835]|uniref:ribonuclease H1 domain-containing protein n=1 Tax=Enterococcus sp. CSURQ0835 TaxID=2681394 RepID=UPI001359B88F|nr:ribonuclease H family protein [Enterococcus sp. CSURQ0835]